MSTETPDYETWVMNDGGTEARKWCRSAACKRRAAARRRRTRRKKKRKLSEAERRRIMGRFLASC